VLLYTITLLLVIFLVWTSVATLDEVSRGDGKVVPSSDVQVIQNLEGGIVEEFLVKEGQAVKSGDVLVRMRNVQAKADFAATTQKYSGIQAAGVL
jgi:adhesin transport system membrane fusion protein